MADERVSLEWEFIGPGELFGRLFAELPLQTQDGENYD